MASSFDFDTSSINSATNSAANGVAKSSITSGVAPTNPKAELNQEDFLKLLLTELQYQNPTEPMDSKAMLEQTSMLSQLSMQQKTNEVMTQLASQMETAFSMSAMSALGKYATLDNVISKDDATKFLGIPITFTEDILAANISIKDKSGNVVRNIELGALSAGSGTINWDLLNNSKNVVENGNYTYSVQYINKEGKIKDMSLKNFQVEAVRFKDGVAQIKIGGSYINVDKVSEFHEKLS